MIKIKEWSWQNMFSYGEELTTISTENAKVQQLVGSNGSGKSSITLVLEELLYNKNSKGIKKADIRNRKNGSKSYSGTVSFSVEGVPYTLSKQVASTAKVQLLRDGEDISGHTATQTYKQVEEIIGLDFKSFTKLVNQSLQSNLDFLEQTDGKRKEFLVGLLSLEPYLEKGQIFKDKVKEVKLRSANLAGKVSTLTARLKKSSELPEKIEPVTVPQVDVEAERATAAELANMLNHATEINGSIDRNKANKQKAEQAAATLSTFDQSKIDTLRLISSGFNSEHYTGAMKLVQDLTTKMNIVKAEHNKFRVVPDKCPTCSAPMDNSKAVEQCKSLADQYSELKERKTKEDKALSDLAEAAKAKEQLDFLETKQQAARNKYDALLSVVDQGLSEEYIDVSKTKSDLANTKAHIAEVELSIKQAEAHNRKAEVAEALREQRQKELTETSAELAECKEQEKEILAELSELEVLQKAFSNKGLVAYKIESTIKVLEAEINKYLAKVSDGVFALTFELSGTALKVVVHDEGNQVDFSSLSSGERCKVSVSTLLAIRKLMSSMSNVHLNILVLDEVISALDKNSYSSLVDVLLHEHELNTLIVSHNNSHPLASKLMIVKKGDRSTIRGE